MRTAIDSTFPPRWLNKGSIVAICIVILFITSCRHIEPDPERRSSEAEIRQNIVGLWTLTDTSWYPQINITSDGNFLAISEGRNILIGSWELDGRMLRVKRVMVERTPNSQLNEIQLFPIVYVDAHNLVMAPGISAGGRYTFTK